jgi:hypothetical protein
MNMPDKKSPRATPEMCKEFAELTEGADLDEATDRTFTAVCNVLNAVSRAAGPIGVPGQLIVLATAAAELIRADDTIAPADNWSVLRDLCKRFAKSPPPPVRYRPDA